MGKHCSKTKNMWGNTVAIHTILKNYKVKFSINQLNMKKKITKIILKKKTKKSLKKPCGETLQQSTMFKKN